MHHVDRLQRLAVFEAAARTGSFTAAGAELGMSQPSVTRQVRALEQSLGFDLFERTANRSRLTVSGQQLHAAADSAFSTIERAIADVVSARDVLVLASPAGFAQQLIVPHLDSFHDVLPDRDLRLWLYDRDDELTGGDYDLAVRVSREPWPGCESIDLFDERATPVAAPSLAAELHLDSASAPEDVLAAPLLHMDAEGRPWLSWSDWLREFDLELTPGRRRVVLNNYPTVLQQAVAGRGIALGWRGIVDDLITDGLLVEVGPEVRSDRRYGVSWPTNRDTEDIRAATQWIVGLVS